MNTQSLAGRLAGLLTGLALLAAPPAWAAATNTLATANAVAFTNALFQGGNIFCAFNGTVTLPAEIVLRTNVFLDAGSNTVILSTPTGTNKVRSRLFTIPAGITLSLYNLILANGSNAFGGAISNNGTLWAGNCVFTNNLARGGDGANGASATAAQPGVGIAGEYGGAGTPAAGGALYNLGTAWFDQCHFILNSAEGGNGGNGGNGGAGGARGGNGGNGGNGASARGGAIYSSGAASLWVTNCTFAGNWVYGGLGGQGGTNGAGPGTSYPGRGGSGDAALGGALYCENPAWVEASTFSINAARAGDSQGGGSESGRGAPGRDGASAYGGALCNNGLLRLVNCTFNADEASGGNGGNGGDSSSSGGVGGNGGNAQGGALFNSLTAGVTNCTFHACGVVGGTNGAGGSAPLPGRAGYLGAGYGASVASSGGTIFLKNSILNLPAAGVNTSGPISDSGFNLCSDASLSIVSTNTLAVTNALLADLADNGGLTLTLQPLPGSPAIDKIDLADCPPLDQRGQPRAGARADIGACEYPFSTLSGRVHSNTLAGAGVYRVALTLSNESTGVLLSTLTDTTGYYDFADLSPTNYTLFSASEDYLLFPETLSAVLTTNIGNLDFVASPLYLVAGRIVDATNTSHGIQDVDVFCEYGQTVTDANGEFQLRVPAGALTVLPDHPEYVFTPFQVITSVGAGGLSNLLFYADGIYTVSGRITDGSSGLAGVTVSSAGRSTQTVPGGYYTLPGLAPGTNRIVPAMPDYTFTPPLVELDLGSDGVVDVVGIDFQARQSITLSGTVSNRAATAAMDGVLMVLTNTTSTNVYTTVVSNGAFTILAPIGTNTLVAVQAGYGFYPPFITVVATNSTNRLNFAGFQSFSITGLALEPYNGVSNVLMEAVSTNTFFSTSAVVTNTASTSGSGLFVLSNLVPGIHTVTPRRAGYTFTPASTNLDLSTASIYGFQFMAAGAYTISTRVTNATGGPVAGVLVTATNFHLLSGRRSATTDTNGSCSISNLPPYIYQLSATKAGAVFTPAFHTNIDLTARSASTNFLATTTYAVSGRVTDGTNAITGVLITVTNPVLGRAFTVSNTASGRYDLAVPEGANIISAFKAGTSFDPFSVSTNVAGNLYEINFKGAPGYSIGGVVATYFGIQLGNFGVSNILVRITNLTVYTDAFGRYLYPSLPPGNYKVQPEATNYTFEPSFANITLPPSTNAVNFTATRRYTIQGKILFGGTPVPDVSLVCTGATARSDALGNYVLTRLPAGTNTVTPSLKGFCFSPASRTLNVGPSDGSADFDAFQFLATAARLPNSNLLVQFTAAPAGVYLVQSATNLGGSLTNPLVWTPFLTTNADTNGLFQFITGPTNKPGRLFRGVAQ